MKKQLKLKTLLTESLKPAQIKPGYIYLARFESDQPGEWFKSKEICIAKDRTDIAFFLIDEYPDFDKNNMKRILSIKGNVGKILDKAYEIDDGIHDQIIITNILKDGTLETELGGKKEILKQVGQFK